MTDNDKMAVECNEVLTEYKVTLKSLQEEIEFLEEYGLYSEEVVHNKVLVPILNELIKVVVEQIKVISDTKLLDTQIKLIKEKIKAIFDKKVNDE